jgi:hypothetical protein
VLFSLESMSSNSSSKEGGRGETLSCTMMGSLDGVKEGGKKKKDEDQHHHIPFFVPSFYTLTEQLHDCCQRKKGLCTHQQHNYYEREREREREREPRDIRGDGRCKKNPRLIGQSHPHNVGEKQKGILLQPGSRNNKQIWGPPSFTPLSFARLPAFHHCCDYLGLITQTHKPNFCSKRIGSKKPTQSVNQTNNNSSHA